MSVVFLLMALIAAFIFIRKGYCIFKSYKQKIYFDKAVFWFRVMVGYTVLCLFLLFFGLEYAVDG